MMSLNHILRKCTAGYKLTKSKEKMQHLLYTDDIKLFAKNEKVLETLQTVRIYSHDIGMEFGIEKYPMLIMKSWKRHMTEGMGLKFQILRILEANSIKQRKTREKN